MAVIRQNQYCHFCGEQIHELHLNQSDVPDQMKLIGDTFIGWDYKNHVCNKDLLMK